MEFTVKQLLKQVLPDTECWEFRGPRNADGYGRMYSGDKELKAHRVFYGPVRSRSRMECTYSITFRLASVSDTPAAIQTISGSATRPRLPRASRSRLPLQRNSRRAQKATR